MYDIESMVFPQPELWKDIEGYEGYYRISSYGRVESLERLAEWYRKDGRYGCRTIPARFLKPKIDKDGYHEYTLCLEGKPTWVRGHRLVAKAFLPEPEGTGLVIDHKDGSKTNNMPWNLQWITSTANTIKYYSEEFGKEKTLSSLTKEEWVVIGDMYNKGVLYKDICDRLGLTVESPDTIWSVLSGSRLSSVTGFKEGDYKIRPHPVQKLSDDQVLSVLYERLVYKTPLKVLSNKYNIAESMISRFCSGDRRPELLKIFNRPFYGL